MTAATLECAFSPHFPWLQSRTLAFLTVPDLLACRQTSKTMKLSADQRIVARRDSRSVFIIAPRMRGRLPCGAENSTCDNCEAAFPLKEKHCPSCGRPRVYASDASAAGKAFRLFVGQLPLSRTAPLLHWMISASLPTVRILHIEVHTSRGGKSRGCAWVHVDSEKSCKEVMGLHQRVMFGQIPLGDSSTMKEGFWMLSGAGRKNPEDLLIMCPTPTAGDEDAGASGAVRYLPTKPLVVERPAIPKGGSNPLPTKDRLPSQNTPSTNFTPPQHPFSPPPHLVPGPFGHPSYTVVSVAPNHNSGMAFSPSLQQSASPMQFGPNSSNTVIYHHQPQSSEMVMIHDHRWHHVPQQSLVGVPQSHFISQPHLPPGSVLVHHQHHHHQHVAHHVVHQQHFPGAHQAPQAQQQQQCYSQPMLYHTIHPSFF